MLIRGDPHHLVPRAKWHLPSASAAELPLAHELPREQVSEPVVEKELMAFQGEAQHGQRPGGGGRALGVPRKARTPGWVEQRERWPYAHSQHLSLYSWGYPGGLPGGGVPPFTHMPSLSEQSLLGIGWPSLRGFLSSWYPDPHSWKVGKE